MPGSTQPVVRIGLVAPFEGRHREIGYDLIYAVRMAIREWNEKGGVAGYRVELVALDDGGNHELALRAAQSLLIDPQVMGVIGHWLSATTEAAKPLYRQAGMALIETDEMMFWSGETPVEFVAAYSQGTPFGEEPGPRALVAYNATNQLIKAIGDSIEINGHPNQEGVSEALASAVTTP